MKKSSRILALALLLGILTACQPTPEESAVVNKQQDLTESVTATEDNQLADLPSSYTVEAQELTDRLTVEINAEITVPASGKLPVARLSKLGIDQETGVRWLTTLADGRAIYAERTLADYSVQELTDAVDYIRATGDFPVRLALMDDFVDTSQEEAIASVQRWLDTAPAEPQYHYYSDGDPVLDRTFEFDSDYEVCMATIANGGYALFYSCYQKQEPDGLVTALDTQEPFGVTLSQEEAQTEAEALLEKLGMADFTLDAAGWIPYSDYYDEKYESYEALPKCYALYFTKQIGGMNETYVDPTYVRISNREESYNAVWEPEYIEVYVADEGVLSVHIPEYPSQVELLSDNVQILDFSEIMDRFYEQVKVSGCYIDESLEDSIEKRTVHIDEIVLGGMRVIEQNADTYLYVPVWSFFGSVTSQYKEGEEDPNQVNENNEIVNRNYRQCVLTISAIDGRVISRSQGY